MDEKFPGAEEPVFLDELSENDEEIDVQAIFGDISDEEFEPIVDKPIVATEIKVEIGKKRKNVWAFPDIMRKYKTKKCAKARICKLIVMKRFGQRFSIPHKKMNTITKCT